MRYGGTRGKPESLFFRVLSAVVGLPVYAWLIYVDWLSSSSIMVVSSVVSLFCLYEFYQLSSSEDKGKPFVLSGVLTGLLLNVLMYLYAYGKVYQYNRYLTLYDMRPVLAIVFVFVAVIMSLQIFKRPKETAIYSVSVTVFGVIFIVLSFSHIILMKALPYGIYYILVIHLVVMANDTFAYFGGSMFGHHKSGISVSPNKSWEGYFSGILFSVIVMICANEALTTFLNIRLFEVIESIFIGLVLSVLANFGDLIESAMKRAGGFKDSGTLIKGHGGMWDVFDALVFTMPFFYYYLKLKGI